MTLQAESSLPQAWSHRRRRQWLHCASSWAVPCRREAPVHTVARSVKASSTSSRSLLGPARRQGSGFDGSGPLGASLWGVRKLQSRPAPAPTQTATVDRQMLPRAGSWTNGTRLVLPARTICRTASLAPSVRFCGCSYIWLAVAMHRSQTNFAPVRAVLPDPRSRPRGRPEAHAVPG
jgi:hypothetical protein